MSCQLEIKLGHSHQIFGIFSSISTIPLWRTCFLDLIFIFNKTSQRIFPILLQCRIHLDCSENSKVNWKTWVSCGFCELTASFPKSNQSSTNPLLWLDDILGLYLHVPQLTFPRVQMCFPHWLRRIPNYFSQSEGCFLTNQEALF